MKNAYVYIQLISIWWFLSLISCFLAQINLSNMLHWIMIKIRSLVCFWQLNTKQVRASCACFILFWEYCHVAQSNNFVKDFEVNLTWELFSLVQQCLQSKSTFKQVDRYNSLAFFYIVFFPCDHVLKGLVLKKLQ